MQFLNKLYEVRDTTISLQANPTDNLEALVGEDIETETPLEDKGQATPFPMGNSQAAKWKHKKQDKFNLEMLKVLEPNVTCSKMSFLQSLMLYLAKYSVSEFLQFQMGVLKVDEHIYMEKQGLFMPIRNPTLVNQPAPQPLQQQFSPYYI